MRRGSLGITEEPEVAVPVRLLAADKELRERSARVHLSHEVGKEQYRAARPMVDDEVLAFSGGVAFYGYDNAGRLPLYHWTLTGTNTGPAGTGNQVRISGYENWRIGSDGLIADPKGYYDAQDWDRQVTGVDGRNSAMSRSRP